MTRTPATHAKAPGAHCAPGCRVCAAALTPEAATAARAALLDLEGVSTGAGLVLDQLCTQLHMPHPTSHGPAVALVCIPCQRSFVTGVQA